MGTTTSTLSVTSITPHLESQQTKRREEGGRGKRREVEEGGGRKRKEEGGGGRGREKEGGGRLAVPRITQPRKSVERRPALAWGWGDSGWLCRAP